MKLNFIFRKLVGAERIVQWFGDARLVQHANGRYELIGGNRADLIAAREWISLFGHDIVLGKPENTRRPALPH